jgi:hypothetical protein
MSGIAFELAKKLVDKASDVNTNGLYISVTTAEDGFLFIDYKYSNEKENKFSGSSQKLTGWVECAKPENFQDAMGECLDSFIVKNTRVSVKGGYGRLLYYIAMHFAGESGITPDRAMSSSDDVGAWNNLYNDSSVKKVALDDYKNPQTPPKRDDCNLASSGLYGDEESSKSYSWNEKLSDEEYRKMKASKLNYVYIGSFPEVINLLASNGKLYVDNKKLNESVSLYSLLFKNSI